MTWGDAIWPIIVSAGLVLIPGGAIGYFLGLRRISLLGLAPVFSISVIALTAIVLAPLHIRWGLIPVVVAVIILSLAAWVIRRIVVKRHATAFASPSDVGLTRWMLGGTAIAAVAIGWRLMATIGAPSNISQTYDAVFHLNALRYIMNTGNASSFSLLGPPINGIETGGFYPGAWHDLTTLVVLSTGTTIPVAVSVVTVVIGALVWPLGLLFLIRTISAPRRLPLIVGGVIATGFAAFPYLMMDFGVVYAFYLGLALLPVGWGLVTTLLGFSPQASLSKTASAIALAIALPGLSLAHASVTMTLIALCGPLVLLLVIRLHRSMRAAGAQPIRFAALYACALALVLVVGGVFYLIQPGNMWHPASTWPEAFVELIFDAPVKLGPAFALSAVVTLGLVVSLVLKKNVWLLLSWLMFAALFIVAAAADSNILRSVLLGMWYGDVYRMAALLALIEAPLAAIGLVWLIDKGHGLFKGRTTSAAYVAALMAVLAVVMVLFQTSNLNTATATGQSDYAMTQSSRLLTIDENSLLEQVPAIVPANMTIAGNPWTGTSLVYALANRVPILSHPGGDVQEVQPITQDLQNAATNPAVCETVRKYNVGYVLNFGDAEVFPGQHIYKGLVSLDNNPSVERVASVGSASLWRITACH